MKALITGGSGTLAGEFKHELKKRSVKIVAYTSQELDVTHKSELLDVVTHHAPDVIFHCAAKTDVDWCEIHPQESWEVNTQSVGYVAEAAKRVGAVLVFPSTYYVYEGLVIDQIDDRIHRPDVSQIRSVYALHKLKAEQLIEKADYHRIYILRIGSLFGGGSKDKKFVGKLLRLTKNQKRIDVVSDRYIQPTYVKDVVHNILALIPTSQFGTYNMVAHGIASYFDYAAEILKGAKIEDIRLIPIIARDYKESAPRSEKIFAINGKLMDLKLDLMRPWQSALKEYLSKTVL